MLRALSRVWMPLGAEPQGPRWLPPTGAAEAGGLVRDRWNGEIWGDFGVDLRLLLQHRGAGSWWPQPWSPVPGRWVEGEDGHPGGGWGVCPNVGDIPVVSFPHGDSSRNFPVPQQPPPRRLISHFQTLNFLIKTCPCSGTELPQVGAVAGGGRWAHPPSPQTRGPLSRRGRRILGWSAIPHWGSSTLSILPGGAGP